MHVHKSILHSQYHGSWCPGCLHIGKFPPKYSCLITGRIEIFKIFTFKASAFLCISSYKSWSLTCKQPISDAMACLMIIFEPLAYWIYSRKHKNTFIFSNISRNRNGAVSLNPSQWKTKICLTYKANTMTSNIMSTEEPGHQQRWYWPTPGIFQSQYFRLSWPVYASAFLCTVCYASVSMAEWGSHDKTKTNSSFQYHNVCNFFIPGIPDVR